MYQDEQKKDQAEAMSDIELCPLECSVCMSVYDEVNRRPRNLPCGHTYCSVCICSLIQDGYITCPGCRTAHCATDTSPFPISYTVEAIVRATSIQQRESASQARGEICSNTAMPREHYTTGVRTKWKGGKGLTEKIRLKIQKQRMNVQSMQNSVQEELDQLMSYRAKLSESQAKHNDVLKELKALVEQHQSAINVLVEEDVKVESLVVEGETVKTELKDACDKLDQVIEAQNAFVCIGESVFVEMEVEEWLEHIKEDIPNGPVLSSSFTMLTTTKILLDSITKEATGIHVTSGHLDCTIMEAVNKIEGRTQQIEPQDLHTERLKESLEDGRVFVVHENEDGTCNSSQVKSKDNRLYMSALKSKSAPPPGSFTIQVDKLVSSSFPCLVFLDFVWPGTDPRRVVIRLSSNTLAGQQFVLMCTGQRTHSYRGTNLYDVWSKGENDEFVCGGNYAGRGGTNLLGDISSGQYRKGDGAGDVCWLNGGNNSTRFGITTGNSKYGGMFGKVIEGLEVVRAAAKHKPIEEVKVEDCGVVCCGDSNN